MICPKCGYERRPTDMAPDYECPKCGIVYAKFNAARAPAPVLQPVQASHATSAATETKNKPNFLASMFAKIVTRDDALKFTKEGGGLLIGVAILQAIVGSFLARQAHLSVRDVLVGSSLLAACGVFVLYKHSRVAAVVALLLSALAVLATAMNLAGKNVGGGSNIFLAVIVAIASARAVEATFKLNGVFKESADTPASGLKPDQPRGMSVSRDN